MDSISARSRKVSRSTGHTMAITHLESVSDRSCPSNGTHVCRADGFCIRRPRRNIRRHQPDERIAIPRGEPLIESPLEANRGEGLSTEAPAAHGAGERARIHLHEIWELPEPGRALKQRMCTVLGTRGELR